MLNSTHGTDCVGAIFGQPDAPCISAVPVGAAPFTVTNLDKLVPGREFSDVILPAADAYFLMLYLESAAHADILSDGSHTKVRDYPAGSVCLVDLSAGAAIRLHSSLRSLSFVLPKRLLTEVSQLSSNGPTDLRCLRGAYDPVLSSLSATLLPLFGQRGGSETLLRHVALAICAHLLHEYGNRPGPRPRRHCQ